MDADQNRSEFKFLLQPGNVAEVQETISRNLAPDRGLTSGYVVLSEYFDSPTLACYWQKMDGAPNRRRLRSRIYVDPSGMHEPTAFIEIKHKLEVQTVKRRMQTDLTTIAGLSNGVPPPACPGACPKVRDEIIRILTGNQMRPRVQIRYQRHAYDSGRNGSLRVTLDRDIRCRTNSLPTLSIHSGDFGQALIPAGCRVMEIKTIGAVPGWVRHLCATLRLVPLPFSKYSASLQQRAADLTARPISNLPL